VFIGDYYFPNGEMDVKGGAALYGALFGNNFVQSGGNVSLHYDKANAGDSDICAPPTGNTCSSCLDCANQACVSGTCGSCTNDGQCCAPLRCVDSVGNACTSSGCSCQFTGF
jgi:hypothetical protein